MGRSTKTRSNSALVESHAVGAQVTVVQVLAHDRFGAIAYQWPQHWRYHFDFANTASKKLAALHEEVLELEPDKNGIRFVADDTLLQDVYEVGNAMVSNAVRAVQHLAQDIGRVCKRNLCGSTAEERIREAVALFSTTGRAGASAGEEHLQWRPQLMGQGSPRLDAVGSEPSGLGTLRPLVPSHWGGLGRIPQAFEWATCQPPDRAWYRIEAPGKEAVTKSGQKMRPPSPGSSFR